MSVVAKLRRYIESAWSKGIEPGGLLLGQAQGPVIAITAFGEIERDGNSGEYVLNPSEQDKLQQQITEMNSSGVRQTVVGYFRGAADGAIRLSQHDQGLIEKCFRNPSYVFLVVAREGSGSPMAGFFFWESGSIFGDASFMPIPLDERLLFVNDSAAVNREADSVDAESNQFTPSIPKRPTFHPRIAISVVGIVTALIAVGLFYKGANAPLPSTNSVVAVQANENQTAAHAQTAATALSISGSTVGRNIEIAWDLQSSAVRAARVGVLTVKDGGVRSEIPLTAEQLNFRKFVYTPKTSRVEASLELFALNGRITSGEMLFAVSKPAGRSAARPASSAAATSEFRGLAAGQGTETPRAAITNETSRRFVPPAASGINPIVRNIILEPPPAIIAVPFDVSKMITSAPVPQMLPPRIMKQLSTPSRPHQDRRMMTNQIRNPIQQVRPTIPASVAAMLHGEITVDVRLRVDNAGRVMAAEPIAADGSLSSYLASAAAAAAKLWKFEPSPGRPERFMDVFLVKFTFQPAGK